jgi:hypothetical protein
LSDNRAWVTHHKKLDKHFSQFLYEKLFWEEQLWKDGEDNIVFIFLLGRLTNGGQNFTLFLRKLKVSHYHSCKHGAGTLKATQWISCFELERDCTLDFISGNFLKFPEVCETFFVLC